MIELNFASVKLRQRQQWERDLISTELRWKFDNECDSMENSAFTGSRSIIKSPTLILWGIG